MTRLRFHGPNEVLTKKPKSLFLNDKIKCPHVDTPK